MPAPIPRLAVATRCRPRQTDRPDTLTPPTWQGGGRGNPVSFEARAADHDQADLENALLRALEGYSQAANRGPR